MNRLIPIHHQLLQVVASVKDRLAGRKLTTFLPMRGLTSTSELMVVGRAVNGWSELDWTAHEAGDPIRRTEIIREVFEASVPSKGCPMEWVNRAWGNTPKRVWNAKRSPFWRLIHSVSQSMFGISEQWPSRLIWSNLYEVAPKKGGNPGSTLSAVQQQACEIHLAKEVDIWKPKRILFITGWNWAKPFIERLGVAVGNESAEPIEWSGTVETPSDKVRVVVSVRPEGRQETPLTEAILRAFA